MTTAIHNRLASVRWPHGTRCPRCCGRRVSAIQTRKQWTCLKCRYRFSVTSGTVLHHSHIPLEKQVAAIWQLVEFPNVSARRIYRDIGVGQEAGSLLVKKLRPFVLEHGPMVMDHLFAKPERGFVSGFATVSIDVHPWAWGNEGPSVHADRLRERIHSALATLDEDHRDALCNRFYDDMTIRSEDGLVADATEEMRRVLLADPDFLTAYEFSEL